MDDFGCVRFTACHEDQDGFHTEAKDGRGDSSMHDLVMAEESMAVVWSANQMIAYLASQVREETYGQSKIIQAIKPWYAIHRNPKQLPCRSEEKKDQPEVVQSTKKIK